MVARIYAATDTPSDDIGWVTVYRQFQGRLFTGDTDIVSCRLKIRANYTATNLYVRVTANTLPDGAMTFTSIKNGAAGNLTFAVGFGATGEFEDTLHNDVLVNGNTYQCQLAGTGSGGMLTWCILSVILDGATHILGAGPNQLMSGGATYYHPIVGYSMSAIDVESQSQYKFETATTLSKLRLYVSFNALAASTVRVRINAADGNEVLNIGGAATGDFEDAVNSDNIVAGNLVCIRCIGGAGGVNALVYHVPHVDTSVSSKQTAGAYAQGTPGALGATQYYFLEGMLWAEAVEATLQTKSRVVFTARKMMVRVITGTPMGDATVRLRKNGIDGILGVTIGAGATGEFEDLVNLDPIIATDKINYRVTNPAGGAVTISIIGIEQGLTSGGARPMGNIAHKLASIGVI